MRDIDVRQALRAQKLAPFYRDPHTRVVEELGLCQGASRVDIAVVNGSLHGYEIKSEFDTLARLEQQAEFYGLIFDRMTIVLGKSHLEAASKRIPDWWGIDVAEADGGGLRIVTRRRGRRNWQVSAYHIAQLLWRDEALLVLSKAGLAKGLLSKPRAEIWSTLAVNFSIRKLQATVRGILKARANWRSPEQPT